MAKNKTFHKKKTLVVFLGCMLMLTALIGRLVNLMVVESEYYAKKADDLHERERKIKAARGRILDANGVVLADNKTVCTISVIHSQIKEPEKVIAMLTKELGIDEAEARKRVNKISSIERVKTNVEKEVGDKIREYQLAGWFPISRMYFQVETTPLAEDFFQHPHQFMFPVSRDHRISHHQLHRLRITERNLCCIEHIVLQCAVLL